MQGLITNIQRFSVHDGPGIRTTVFLKGCPLHCFWCHNPEDMRPKVELQQFVDRCIACDECLAACPDGAIRVDVTGRAINREVCTACGRCVEKCVAESLVLSGRWIESRDLVADLLLDRVFYERSGGGITLSGGEPALQADFSEEILRLAHGHGLHTAIETAAYCRWDELSRMLPSLDLVIFDLKSLDDRVHRDATGVSNALILENAARLAASGRPLIVRTPVIPGVNDTPEAIAAVARFIAPFSHVLYYELLPYHQLSEGKYRSLGMVDRSLALHAPGQSLMEELAAVARASGLRDVRLA